MKLLDLIKTALKKAGLEEALADELIKDKVKSEEDIETVIDELKEKKKADLTEADFDKLVKEAGLAELHEKIVKAAVDKVLQKAIQTHDEKLKAKADEALKEAKEKEAKKKREEEMTDDQKRYSKLDESIASLNEKFGQLLDKTSKDGLHAKVKAALKEAELDEAWADRISVEKEEEIEAAVGELKTMVDAREQENIDKKLKELGIPEEGNGKSTTPTESLIAETAKSTSKGEHGGKLIGRRLTVDEPEKK